MKVLIIKLSSLGDVLHTIPAVNAIKSANPGFQIDWLIDNSNANLISQQKSLGKVISFDKKNIQSYIQTIQTLRANKYDLVIDFHGLIKTALISFLVAPRRIGFKYPREQIATWFYNELIDAGEVLDNSLHVVEKNLKVSEHLGSKLSKEANGYFTVDYGSYKAPIQEQGKSLEKITCIIPGTTWESKHWLAQRWAELIEELVIKRNHKVLIIGSKQNDTHVQEIYDSLSETFKKSQEKEKLINLLGKTQLNELATIFQKSKLIIGVDTGPLHMAAAAANPQQTKIIGLYGPTSAKRTGPYGFDYLSTDEMFNSKASHKRTIAEDGGAMHFITVKHILDLL